VQTAGLGGHNRAGIDVLTRFRGPARVLLPIVATIAIVFVVRWLKAERGHRANPAKWVYVGSTAALFVVMFVSPIAGFIGYVGAHAVEYFVIVSRSIGPRYTPEAVAASPSPLGRLVATRAGRIKFFLLYAAAMAVLVGALSRTSNLAVHASVIFTLGGMHVFYDGFIWKLRRPVVARSLGIAAGT
jgi:hypothetical protein